MDKNQLRELITDVLEQSNLIKYEDKREVELLMMTAAVESRLGHYIKQVGGPALGIFQMEPATHRDITKNYIAYNEELKKVAVKSITTSWIQASEELKYNLLHAIIMTRIHYLRAKGAIPPADDVEGLAKYWKDHYNTKLGKGTVEKAIEAYNKYAI